MGAFADDSFVSVDADSEDELKTNLERVGEDVLRFFASHIATEKYYILLNYVLTIT